jgi:signal peptidase I
VFAGRSPSNTRCGTSQSAARPTPTKLQVDGHDVNYIKRVVAGPGDTLYITGGHAFVNGKRQKDDFTRPCEGGTGCDFPGRSASPPGTGS